jgi:uncharacterized LabA/DUF88 family protein
MCINPENELQQCIASGQVDASQVVQHAAAGEYATRIKGDNMVDLQELKRLAEIPGDIGRNELAFWMADHAHEFIAEVESLRRQLEEVTSYRDAFKSLYDKALDDIGAVLVSRDADIERAIRLVCEQSEIVTGYRLHYDAVVASVLAQMKEQGNG